MVVACNALQIVSVLDSTEERFKQLEGKRTQLQKDKAQIEETITVRQRFPAHVLQAMRCPATILHCFVPRPYPRCSDEWIIE